MCGVGGHNTLTMPEYTSDYAVDTVEEAVDAVRRYGVATFPVLSPDEVAEMNAQMWDALETIGSGVGISRHDRATWREFKDSGWKRGGLQQHFGLWGSPWRHRVATNPKVVAPFEVFYETPKLHVSLDGVNYACGHLIPNNPGRIGCDKSRFTGDDGETPDFHCDQAFGKPDLRMLQGFVNGTDCAEGDACLRVLQSSHDLFSAFGRAFGLTEQLDDWHKLTAEQIRWFVDRGCRDVCIKAKAGHMVLWDSRTVHFGQAPFADASLPPEMRRPDRQPRNVVYVCCAPASWATPKALQMRKEAFGVGVKGVQFRGRTFAHAPHLMRPFAKFPRYYDVRWQVHPPLDPESLSDADRYLYGLEPYPAAYPARMT